jgi:hypothetical protein
VGSNPAESIDVFLLYVLSDRGLCDGPIPLAEEYYRLWWVIVCDLETSTMRRPWPALGCFANEDYTYVFVIITLPTFEYSFVADINRACNQLQQSTQLSFWYLFCYVFRPTRVLTPYVTRKGYLNALDKEPVFSLRMARAGRNMQQNKYQKLSSIDCSD